MSCKELRRYCAFYEMDPNAGGSHQLDYWRRTIYRADRVSELLADAAMEARLGFDARWLDRQRARHEKPQPDEEA